MPMMSLFSRCLAHIQRLVLILPITPVQSKSTQKSFSPGACKRLAFRLLITSPTLIVLVIFVILVATVAAAAVAAVAAIIIIIIILTCTT